MPALPMDEAALTERVSKALGREVKPVTTLSGGASSLVYWTETIDDGEKMVIKSCQPGLEPVRNRDMLRQARAHQALTGTPVPVPAVLATDAGAPPEVPPFFITAWAQGVCEEVAFMAPDLAPPPEQVRGRLLECARLMGELHKLDPNAIGLGDEPETSLQAEVERWTASLNACEEDLRSGSEPVGERLLATIPKAAPSRLVHGDFRTGNVLAEGDRVTSVIDWEIWSRTDPRVDLGWFLLFAEDERRQPVAGMPPADELLGIYLDASGTPDDDLDWFRALVRYKQFSTGAFITRNARRRGAPVEVADNSTNWLLTSAAELLG